MLGEFMLDARGRSVAREVTTRVPEARVIVNGGNCNWPDVNWVHCLHHAWPCRDDGAPRWFRAKNRLKKQLARWREAAALPKARVVIANSERTRRDLIQMLALDPDRVRTVRLGAGEGDVPPSAGERCAARQWLGFPSHRPLVAFVGALGYDANKGLDTLWSAWRALCADSRWDADLVIAGGGRAAPAWKETIERSGLAPRVSALGFTDRVAEVLAAADLLVSPVRYESFGLNVQEALCRGLPAVVSAQAGVSELYPSQYREWLLPDPEDVDDLASDDDLAQQFGAMEIDGFKFGAKSCAVIPGKRWHAASWRPCRKHRRLPCRSRWSLWSCRDSLEI